MVFHLRSWYRRGLLRLLGVALVGGGLMAMGCAHVKPFEPPQVDEIPDGPGLFTGEKGALVLSREFGANSVAPVSDDAREVQPSAPGVTPSVPRELPTEKPGKPVRKTPPL